MDEKIALLVFAIKRSYAQSQYVCLSPRLRSVLEELPWSELAEVAEELKRDRDLDRLILELNPEVLSGVMCAVAQGLGKRIQF